MEEILLSFGGELKALGNGKFGGYLVRFSDENSTDLEGDFFTKSTEFFQEDGARLPILFEHGLDTVIKRRKIGMGTIKTDEMGVWLEFHLSRRDKYEKAIAQMTAKGKTGLSSGAANHLVAKSKVNKANRVDEWGLAEASVTFTPMEPTSSIMTLKAYSEMRDGVDAALKSILIEDDEDDSALPEIPVKANSLAATLTKFIDDRIDDGHDRDSIIKSLARESGLDTDHIDSILAGEAQATVPNLKAFARVLEVSFDALKAAKQRDYSRSIKGMFEEVLADRTPSRWELDSVYSGIIRKLAATAQASAITGVEFNLEGKVKEATSEYMSRLQSHAVAQIEEYVSSGSDEPFYLKAIIDLSQDLPVSGHLNLESHSQLAVSALRDVIKRFRANHEARQREGNNQKAGRVLSTANRQRLSAMLEQIQAAVSDCQTLLDESKPMATDAEKRAAETAFLRLQHQALQRGLNAN
jgi:phage head maturation protease